MINNIKIKQLKIKVRILKDDCKVDLNNFYNLRKNYLYNLVTEHFSYII